MAVAAIPAWVAWTSLAVSAAGAVYGGVTSYRTAKFNQKVANNEADYQRNKAKLDAEKHREKFAKFQARGKVQAAKSGVSILSTTADEVFNENLEEGLFDAAMIRYGGERAAESAETQASLFGSQAQGAVIGTAAKVGSTILTDVPTKPTAGGG